MGIWTALASVGGSIISARQNNKNIDKQLAAQSKENQKNREYNLELAKMQNQWNLNQWQLENAYNSPAAQMERMRQAGLNPDMMYGGGVSGNLSASSPALTSGAPSSPMDWSSLANRSTVGDVVSSYLDTQLKQAQINKLNSETEGQDINNDILASDSKFRDAWNQGQLDTMYAKIQLEGSQRNLNEQLLKESQSKVMQINALTNQLNASARQIYNQIKNDNARLDMEKLRNDAEIKRIAKECNLTDAQRERLINEWEYLTTQYDDAHSISVLEKGRLEITNDQLTLEGKMTYGNYDSTLTTWENVLKFMNQITTYAVPFIKR